MRTAATVPIVFGCSVLRNSSAPVALRSQTGTLAVAVFTTRMSDQRCVDETMNIPSSTDCSGAVDTAFAFTAAVVGATDDD